MHALYTHRGFSTLYYFINAGDQTGDSGMGSGSGATKYGTIAEWKEAIQNPPPGTCI